MTHSGDDLFISIDKTAACSPTSTADTENLSESISIYPNPSLGSFTIDVEEIGADIKAINLYDINGQMMRDLVGQRTFDIDESGVYLLQFVTTDANVTKKIIVK